MLEPHDASDYHSARDNKCGSCIFWDRASISTTITALTQHHLSWTIWIILGVRGHFGGCSWHLGANCDDLEIARRLRSTHFPTLPLLPPFVRPRGAQPHFHKHSTSIGARNITAAVINADAVIHKHSKLIEKMGKGKHSRTTEMTWGDVVLRDPEAGLYCRIKRTAYMALRWSGLQSRGYNDDIREQAGCNRAVLQEPKAQTDMMKNRGKNTLQ